MSANGTEQLQFAIIGCGLVGGKRAAALRGLARTSLVCDSDRGRARQLSASIPGSRPVSDAQEVFSDPSIDAVIISTPNAALTPLALAAVKAGKHVLMEKPGALSADELRTLAQAAQGTGLKLRLGYNHRFHPGLLQARALVDQGVTGPLMFIRARYGHGGRKGYEHEWRANPKLSGGGELIDQGVHLIDLAQWFLGIFPTVEGHAQTCFWDMPVDDNAFLSLRTAQGQTAWLHVSCTEWKNMFSFEIYGKNAKISIEGLGGSYGTERCTLYRMLPEMGPPETTTWEYPRGDESWALETRAFIEDIRLDRMPDPGLEEGLRTLEIVERIYRTSGYPRPVIAP
jgi:predicted dehydrogenase